MKSYLKNASQDKAGKFPALLGEISVVNSEDLAKEGWPSDSHINENKSCECGLALLHVNTPLEHAKILRWKIVLKYCKILRYLPKPWHSHVPGYVFFNGLLLNKCGRA